MFKCFNVQPMGSRIYYYYYCYCYYVKPIANQGYFVIELKQLLNQLLETFRNH